MGDDKNVGSAAQMFPGMPRHTRFGMSRIPGTLTAKQGGDNHLKNAQLMLNKESETNENRTIGKGVLLFTGK